MPGMLEIKDKAVIAFRHVSLRFLSFCVFCSGVIWASRGSLTADLTTRRSSLSSSGTGVGRKDSFKGGAGLGCPGGMEEMGKG